jgi:hypothetical protein
MSVSQFWTLSVKCQLSRDYTITSVNEFQQSKQDTLFHFYRGLVFKCFSHSAQQQALEVFTSATQKELELGEFKFSKEAYFVGKNLFSFTNKYFVMVLWIINKFAK